MNIVDIFELFLEEVGLCYGPQIRDICKQKLSTISKIEEVDELKILDEAKREAGFDIEKSSLASGYIGRFWT